MIITNHRSSRAREKEKLLRKKVGQAIRDYRMINKGDRIAVAVSGGQDSFSLLKILTSKTVVKSLGFKPVALHIETDIGSTRKEMRGFLSGIFEELGLEYHFGAADIVKTSQKEEINCFWCSWVRRKRIFEMADRLNCNKVALGHHKDDIIETLLLNLFYNGEISTMNPNQSMFDGRLHIIRPLCYLQKNEISEFAQALKFQKEDCSCSYGDISKRRVVREVITKVAGTSRTVKTNLFKAPSRIRSEYLGMKGA